MEDSSKAEGASVSNGGEEKAAQYSTTKDLKTNGEEGSKFVEDNDDSENDSHLDIVEEPDECSTPTEDGDSDMPDTKEAEGRETIDSESGKEKVKPSIVGTVEQNGKESKWGVEGDDERSEKTNGIDSHEKEVKGAPAENSNGEQGILSQDSKSPAPSFTLTVEDMGDGKEVSRTPSPKVGSKLSVPHVKGVITLSSKEECTKTEPGGKTSAEEGNRNSKVDSVEESGEDDDDEEEESDGASFISEEPKEQGEKRGSGSGNLLKVNHPPRRRSSSPKRRESKNKDDVDYLGLSKVQMKQYVIQHGLETHVETRACELLDDMEEKRLLRSGGNTVGEVTAACLFVACRQQGVPCTYKEICALTNLKKKQLSRAVRFVGKSLNVGLEPITSQDFIDRFCLNLDLVPEVREAGIAVSRKALSMGIVSGKCPISVAAAGIALVSGCSEREIVAVSGVSLTTIRNCYVSLVDHKDELFEGITLPEMYEKRFVNGRRASILNNPEALESMIAKEGAGYHGRRKSSVTSLAGENYDDSLDASIASRNARSGSISVEALPAEGAGSPKARKGSGDRKVSEPGALDKIEEDPGATSKPRPYQPSVEIPIGKPTEKEEELPKRKRSSEGSNQSGKTKQKKSKQQSEDKLQWKAGYDPKLEFSELPAPPNIFRRNSNAGPGAPGHVYPGMAQGGFYYAAQPPTGPMQGPPGRRPSYQHSEANSDTSRRLSAERANQPVRRISTELEQIHKSESSAQAADNRGWYQQPPPGGYRGYVPPYPGHGNYPPPGMAPRMPYGEYMHYAPQQMPPQQVPPQQMPPQQAFQTERRMSASGPVMYSQYGRRASQQYNTMPYQAQAQQGTPTSKPGERRYSNIAPAPAPAPQQFARAAPGHAQGHPGMYYGYSNNRSPFQHGYSYGGPPGPSQMYAQGPPPSDVNGKYPLPRLSQQYLDRPPVRQDTQSPRSERSTGSRKSEPKQSSDH
eukprot:Nk52_evm4s295 gene=Nk52_evmTU4s295